MSKKRLNNNDFEDFFPNSKPNISKISNSKNSNLGNQNSTENSQNNPTQTPEKIPKSNSKRTKSLTKNDTYQNKNNFKGLYLTPNLAKQLDGISGLLGRTNSDLICEALDKLFNTKKYQEVANLIDKVG